MGTCSCKQGTCQLAAGSLSAVFTHSFCKLRSYTDLLYVNKVQGTCQLAAGSLSAVSTHSVCKLRSYTDLLYVNKVQGTSQLAAGSLSAVSTHSVCKLRSHTDLGYRSLLCAWWLHGNACFVNKILANLLSAPVCPQFVPTLSPVCPHTFQLL